VTTVETFPGRFYRKRTVRAAEMYDRPQPSAEMVWEICPYLRAHADEPRCQQCSRSCVEDIGDGPEEWIRGCYLFAEEACRVVFAVQERERARLVERGQIG
jgi:hypothetical protein